MKYKGYNDYELLYMVRENDSSVKDILYEKYYPVISKIVSEFYENYNTYGWEYDDFFQEAMYTFEKCIVAYDENKDTLFYTFLVMCLRRSLLSFSRNISNKSKNISQNLLVDIEKCDIEDANTSIDKIFENSDLENIYKSIIYDPKLSIEDTSILELRMNGFNNTEISELLDMNYRTIQAKFRRIKKTLKNNVQKYYN